MKPLHESIVPIFQILPGLGIINVNGSNLIISNQRTAEASKVE